MEQVLALLALIGMAAAYIGGYQHGRIDQTCDSVRGE